MATPILAQDAATGEPTLLQKLILIGRGATVGSPADAPTATETTAEEIEDNQITSLEDLGNTTEPGVNVGSEGHGINIRGLEADRVLTTIDGIPISYLSLGVRDDINADGGIDTFDFSALSDVNIMRGADSSRAGSGALGGALLLRTLEAADLIEDGKNFGGFVRTAYDSKDESLNGTLAIAGRSGDTSVLFQGAYTYGHETDNKGTVGGEGSVRSLPNPKDFDQYNMIFKLRHDIEGGHTVGVTAERYHEDSDSILYTDLSATYVELDGNKEKKRDRISLDYSYEAPDPSSSIVDRADLKFYWQDLLSVSGRWGERAPSNSVPGAYGRENEMKERAFGVTGSAENRYEAGSTSHDVTVGGAFSSSKFTQFTYGEDSCDEISPPPYSCGFLHANAPDMPNVDALRLGVFVDDTITFGGGPISLTPGVRFDWYDYSPKETDGYDADLPEARSDYQFSPKLRAEYEVDPALNLFAQWSMGFKSPNVNELYLTYETDGAYRTIGNPDLEPETSNGFEIGATFGDEALGGRVTAFYNTYRNFIDSQTVMDDPVNFPYGTTYYENLDRVRIYGFEADAHRKFANGFSVSAAVAYAYGEDRETGEQIDSIAPMKGILGLGYEAESWGTDLRLIGVASVDEDSTASFKPEGYGIVNLTGWWEPARLEGLRIAGGVYNLFDEEYYDAVKWRDVDLTSSSAQPMAYYSEPGRTFKVSLTQRF
ncbi:TonB-dependent hemoglobin/transferrin/lactoferrin family receptor [Oricola sp.]|uniref:TonB-dependent hemoglobin/transferrin/lactoferrin family receptor n=1 Tax=Oricola sp. TaxID=1979950 RepID=UPI0025ECCDD5|nr:TonB-dependent hemoglobin/transferrin/lactoferrin family receptor [Oricola sp.]MCI5076941.1 TonB-dependent hemoglobin/transferrin/lactoferrin family receptor [Oricola sp.]